MIGPSQRQRAAYRSGEDWAVHRRLARGRDRNRHLLYGSMLALLAALLGWALGLDLGLRAMIVVAAAVLVWLIPLRGSTEWALEWIGDRAGLAYQTALEMNEEDDPYGLRRAVERRANASLTEVERPEHSAWWLPFAALAAGALLLPALPIGGGGGLIGGPIPPGSGGQAPAPQVVEEEAEEPTPNLPGEERTRIAQTPDDGGPNDDRDGEAEAEGDGQTGEREALERYLRSVRERPAELEEEQRDAGEEDAGRAPGGPAPREGAQDRPGGGEGGAEQERSGEGEENRSGDQGGGEGQDESRPPQEGGQQDGEQDGQNPFAEAGGDEDQSQADDPGGEPVEPGDGGPGEEGLQEGGEEATGPGESPVGGEQQGQGQGAGGLPSAEQEAGRAGQLEGETLQLRGDLGEGPLNSGGTVQLPGGDEVQLPPGRTSETYAREVERAVTEGRIPLEYQEIIRNYFR